MDRAADTAAVTVAHNLRSLRESRGLSLGRLAERSGMSKGTLSKLEAGEGNPTLVTLAALARTLSVETSQLLAVSPSGVELVRRGEGLDLGDATLPSRLVKALARDGVRVEVHRLEIPPGGQEVSATHGSGSWEHVIVVSGSVEVGPLGRTEVLGAGDYGVYPADRPHVWRGHGGSPATAWAILTVAG